MICRRWISHSIVTLIALSFGLGHLRAADAPAKDAPETKAERDARMKWWREARFGMFIHWGVYSVPAGTYKGKKINGIGEWIMHNGRIPVAEYKKFPEQFNPVKFDAEKWVQTAKDAGQKYIVITSKHHDGFAMYHSKACDFNIFDATPFKRDPLKELAAACQKHGIKLGFYYSQAQDWTYPGGAPAGPYPKSAWDPAQKGSMDKYLDEKAIPQVKEILTNYGPIAVLWWDTPVGMNPQRVAKLAPLLKLQPGIISNNRLGAGFRGDFGTPEQEIIRQAGDWETCMTMNDTWGYKSYDHNWKSTELLLHNLILIASQGGNYLLNVGPTSEGEFPAPIVERLKGMGKWLKVNGEAIYATSASPFLGDPPNWGHITQKPGRLYLHVIDWPKDQKLVLAGLESKVDKAYLLADEQHAPLATAQEGGKVTITLPEKAPDPIASVVVLQYSGDLKVAQAAPAKPAKRLPRRR